MGRKISRKKAKSDQKLFEKNSLVVRKGSGVGGNGSSDKRRQGGNKTESLRAGSRVSGSSDKTVCIWELGPSKGDCIQLNIRHNANIREFFFHFDSDYFNV